MQIPKKLLMESYQYSIAVFRNPLFPAHVAGKILQNNNQSILKSLGGRLVISVLNTLFISVQLS